MRLEVKGRKELMMRKLVKSTQGEIFLNHTLSSWRISSLPPFLIFLQFVQLLFYAQGLAQKFVTALIYFFVLYNRISPFIFVFLLAISFSLVISLADVQCNQSGPLCRRTKHLLQTCNTLWMESRWKGRWKCWFLNLWKGVFQMKHQSHHFVEGFYVQSICLCGHQLFQTVDSSL